VMLYVYKQAFRQNFFALGAAFGMLVFILLFSLVLINNRVNRITQSAYD
jgi:ABC-type sugar transport system permease subunit